MIVLGKITINVIVELSFEKNTHVRTLMTQDFMHREDA